MRFILRGILRQHIQHHRNRCGRQSLHRTGRQEQSVCFDANGAESVCLSGWRTDDGHDVLPAYKSDGTFDCIAVVYNTESRTGTSKSGYKMNYGIYADLYSAYGGTAAGTGDAPEKIASYSHVRKVSDGAASGSGTDAAKSMYAVQIGNDVIVNNGDWGDKPLRRLAAERILLYIVFSDRV